jgi:hypothetical protein
MSGFVPLLEDKQTSNKAKPGVSVYEYTPWAATHEGIPGRHQKALVNAEI